MAGEIELERMIIRLIGDASSYRRMWQTADAYAVSGVASINATMRRLATGMTVAVTAPLAVMGKSAVNEFGKFDQAMTETFARMGEVSPEVRNQMEELAKTLSMSGQMVFNPTELAKGYEELGASGLNAQQAMAALPIMAEFAQSGLLKMGESVDGLIGSIAAFRGGLPTDAMKLATDMRLFGDMIVSVANTTRAEVGSMAKSMTRDASTAARLYGMELSTLGAILGVYAQQGHVGAEAGNMTGRALRLATSAFLQHRQVWQSMGVDMVNPVTGQWKNFIDVIGLMEKSFKGLTGPQIAAKLHMMGLETLSQKSILPLIGLSKELKRQEKIYKEHGAMAKMAQDQMKSWSNQMAVVWNHVKVLSIEIGEILAPILSELGALIKAGVMEWRSWSSETKRASVVFGVVASLIGPVLAMFTIFGVVASVAAGALGIVAGVIGYLFSPMSLLIAGIALIAAAFLDFDLAAFWESASSSLGRFVQNTGLFFGHFKQNMGILFSWLSTTWDSVWGGVKHVVRESVLNILEIFGALFPNLGWWFKDMAIAGVDSWDAILQGASTFFGNVLGFLANFSQNMDMVWKFFKNNWRNVLDDVGRLFSVMFTNMFTNLGVAVGIMVRMLVAFGGWIAQMFNHLWNEEVQYFVFSGLAKIAEMLFAWGGMIGSVLAAAIIKPVLDTMSKIAKATGSPVIAAGLALLSSQFANGKGGRDQLDEFGQAWGRDISNGVNKGNLLDTFAGIIREESVKFVNLFQGFQSNAMHGLPQFNFDTSGIALLQFNMAPVGGGPGQGMGALEQRGQIADNVLVALGESGFAKGLMTVLDRIAIGIEKNKPPLLQVAELS